MGTPSPDASTMIDVDAQYKMLSKKLYSDEFVAANYPDQDPVKLKEVET